MGFGIIGLLIFILDIYVIYLILTGGASPGMKLLWIIVVMLMPLIGPILYFLIANRAA